MARNCEKHFVRLNRVFLEEQWKREKEKKRPPLHQLNSASEVKKWIPSIKREMNYCLQQLSGARKHDYSEAKNKEFEDRVQYLEREYKRFVRRVFELDPSATDVPWEARAYRKKQKSIDDKETNSVVPSKMKAIEICPELLECQGSTSLTDGESVEPLFDLPMKKSSFTEKSTDDKTLREVHPSKTTREESKTSEDDPHQYRRPEERSLVEYDISDSEED